MPKEIITISVGGAGVKIGDKLGELLANQHQIDSKGTVKSESIYNHHTVFQQTASGRHVPRTLFLDTDSYDIDVIKTGARRDLYRTNGMVGGKQDSSNNFIRGMYTLGKSVIEQAENQVRWLFEQCDYTEGIVMNFSLSGGTGSGVGLMLIQRLVNDMLRKKTLYVNAVIPSPNISNIIVQPYNASFAIAEILSSQTDKLVTCFDNQQLYSSCQRNGIQNPSYNEINQCIARSTLLTTNHLRIRNSTSNFSEIVTNLVPYKQMSFITPHIASTLRYSTVSPLAVFENLYDPSSSLASHGLKEGVNLSICTLLRGTTCSPVLNNCVSIIRTKLKMVDWYPNGIKMIMSANNLHSSSLEGVTLNNNSSFQQALTRIMHQREMLWSKRAFVHWYVGEGIEDSTMREGAYAIEGLTKDYQEVILDSQEGS